MQDMLTVYAECSEVPRKLRPSDWRPLMQATREAAGCLVERDLIEVTQKGVVVRLSEARGPIRLRLTPAGQASLQARLAVPAEGDQKRPRKRGRKQER